MSRHRWVVLLGGLHAVGCGGETAQSLENVRQTALGACVSADESTGFVNQELARQGGVFSLSFDVTPTAAASDALVGVALGPADAYADLAAIVRFNPAGFIDARSGSSYGAVNAIPYSAGVTRHVYLSIDLIRRVYSARIDDQDLARDFAFRSEQLSTVALDSLALKVDEGGALSVCNVNLHTSQACNSATPGQGFVNTSLPPASPAFTVGFTAIPGAQNMDGVMGFSAGEVSSFSALAGAVRFSPSGVIDALDGSSYTPISGAEYIANAAHRFLIVADAVDHTYSVIGVDDVITNGLSFRPQQASVTSLGNFAQISDSAAGPLTVCELHGGGAQGAVWIHESHRYDYGRLSLAISEGRALMSDATRTRVLDSLGHVTREIPYGGSSVADAQGNLYLFGKFEASYDGGTGPVYPTAGGGSVYVSKYDAELRPIYTRVTGTTPEVAFKSASADAQGNVAFVLESGVTSSAVKLDPSGETRWSSDYPVDAIALNGSGEILVGVSQADSLTVSKLDPFGRQLWTQTFPTQGVDLGGVVFSSLGDAAFWGDIYGQIEFGDDTFRAGSSENGSLGLLGLLGADGTPRFVRLTTMQSIRRTISDHSGHLLVVGTSVNPDQWRLDRYDSSGTLTATRGGDELLPGLFLGSSGDVAVDAAGHVYWQFFPRSGGVSLNMLAKLEPF
jgi:hypothetical protein